MVIYGRDRKVVEESAVLGGTGTEIQRAMFDYDAADAPKNCELFNDFKLVLAYHTQGQEIYWQFQNFNPPNSRCV